MSLDVTLKDLGIELNQNTDTVKNLTDTLFGPGRELERKEVQDKLNGIIQSSTEDFVRKIVKSINGTKVSSLKFSDIIEEQDADNLTLTITKKIAESFTIRQLIFIGIFETTGQLLDKVFRSSELSIIGTLYNTFKENPDVPQSLLNELERKFKSLLAQVEENHGEIARSSESNVPANSPADKIINSMMKKQDDFEDDDDFKNFLKST